MEIIYSLQINFDYMLNPISLDLKQLSLILNFRTIEGMATLGHMMSQIMKGRAVMADPVSKVIYKQFKQVSSWNCLWAIINTLRPRDAFMRQ